MSNTVLSPKWTERLKLALLPVDGRRIDRLPASLLVSWCIGVVGIGKRVWRGVTPACEVERWRPGEANDACVLKLCATLVSPAAKEAAVHRRSDGMGTSAATARASAATAVATACAVSCTLAEVIVAGVP